MAMVSALATRVLGRVAIAIALLALSACVPTASPAGSTANAPIAVLGTENFYADLLAQIGGTRVIASSILNDPAADPHEYEASPATAKVVADSKLVIVNGIGYDDFMEKLLGASTKPDRVVINVQELLGAKDDVNVHVWYDPATMPKVADAPRPRSPGSTRRTRRTSPLRRRSTWSRSSLSTTRSPRSRRSTRARPSPLPKTSRATSPTRWASRC